MSTDTALAQVASAGTSQASVGLQLLAYCNSVDEQPKVSFAGFKNLAGLETEVNAGIVAAQGHADTYLQTIKPAMILNITNISNYFELQDAVSTTLPPGSTKQEWLDSLAAVKEQIDEYSGNAKDVVGMFTGLHKGLTTDVGAFASTVSKLNAAVSGDNGVLADLDGQLNDIQGKIAGAISGIVLSGLAVVGGGIMILVGALAEPITGGAATALVVGGAAILIAGVGGAIGSGIALGGFLNAKSDIITKKANLHAEVKLALGMQAGFADLRDQAATAVEAATAMQNAWQFLGDDLGQLSGDLNKGILGTDAVRKLWLTTANNMRKTVAVDIATIKGQLNTTVFRRAPQGKKIGDYVTEVTHEIAA